MSGSRRGAIALVAVGLLLGAVAIASGGATAPGGAGARRPTEWVLDVAISLFALLMVFGAVLTVIVFALRPREIDPLEWAARRRRRLHTHLALVVLLALIAVVAHQALKGDGRGFGAQLFGNRGQATGDAGGGYQPEFTPIPVLVVLVLVLLALAGWTLAWRARRRHAEIDGSLELALEEALDEGLDDLRSERDPRRAVIAAYARLEQVLARHGVPRRPSEAPEEYLRRVLSSVNLSTRAATRLTALFQTAKFSAHDIDATMKEEAIEALADARDELRAARELEELEHAAALSQAPGGRPGR